MFASGELCGGWGIVFGSQQAAESLRDVIVLTPYDVQLRYPGGRPDATPDDAHQAVGLARKTRNVVLEDLPVK